MVWKYWKATCAKAWSATVLALHLNSMAGFLMWILGTAAVITGLIIWGSPDAPHDELVGRIVAALVVFSAVPFVFVWKLIRTPSEMYWCLRDWTADLEKAIIESRETDAALMVLAERYTKGLRLIRAGAEIEELLKWEKECEEYIKSRFDATFFLQVCGPESSPVTYTTRYVNGRKLDELRMIEPEPAAQSRIDSKLRKLGEQLPYAAMNYRGRTINSIDFTYSLIQQVGLPEHRAS